jgi:hypothetical protein
MITTMAAMATTASTPAMTTHSGCNHYVVRRAVNPYQTSTRRSRSTSKMWRR